MIARTFLKMLSALCVALGIAMTVSAGEPTEARRPILSAGVDLVNLNVSVVSGRDRFITNLAQEDFVVIEDGVRQNVVLFDQGELPVSLVVLLDMSMSMGPKLKEVRHAASRLLESMRPQDEAEIVEFSDRPRVLQAFTQDRTALKQAIDRTKPAGPTALHNALYITLKDLVRIEKTQERRRRAIVLLSDGEDTASMVTDEQVLDLARAAEINIYAIMLCTPSALHRDGRRQAHYLLNTLAEETGAEAFFPATAGQLVGVYDRIAQELRSQYSLGYVPSNLNLDGNWRQILVVTSRDGVRVRHRLGYYAVSEAPLVRTKTSAASKPDAQWAARP